MQQHYTNIAFISYKREDEKWAKWLQNKLEHYQLPIEVRKQKVEFAERPRHVFKDTTDLSGGVLEKAIKEGLASSKYLIVICSPRAAKSPWVCKEVQEFIDSGREENIIPFIIDGEPYSKDIEKECFPEALKSLAGEKELLGININENGRDSAAVKVIARMFDIRFDTLWQRFKKSERKRRTLISLIIAFFVLLAVSLVYSFIIYNNNQKQIQMLNLINIISEAETLSSQDKSLSAAHLLISLINEERTLSEEETNLLNAAILSCTEKLVNSKCELISVSKVVNKEDNIQNLSESGDNYMIIQNEDEMYLINKQTTDSLFIGYMSDYPTSCADWLSNDRKYFFLPPTRDCLDGGTVNIYDLSCGLLRREVNVVGSWYAEGNVLSVKPDNTKFLYHYGFRGESGIKEYDINGESKDICTEYEEGDNVEALSAKYSPSGNFILLFESFYDRIPSISIVDAKTYDVVYTFDDLDHIKLKNVYWDEDCNEDVICIEDTTLQKTTLRYSWKINRDSKTISQNKTLQSMCISNDGALVSYSTVGDSVFIYNTQNSRFIYKGRHDAYSMNFNNHGDNLCFVDLGGQVADIFNVEELKISKSLPIELSYNYNCHTGIVFSKDDKTIVFTIGAVCGGISVWDAINCKKVQTDLDADSIFFNHDYSKMVTFEKDNTDGVEYDFENNKILKIQNKALSDYYPYEDNVYLKMSNNRLYYVKRTNENNLKYGKNITTDTFMNLFKVLINQ